MALLSKSCWVLYLLLVAEGNPGPGQEDAGSECPASSIPETVWGVQALREVLAFCGFAGGEEHGVVYLPFSTFPPISQSVSVVTLIGIGLLEKHPFL